MVSRGVSLGHVMCRPHRGRRLDSVATLPDVVGNYPDVFWFLDYSCPKLFSSSLDQKCAPLWFNPLVCV